MIITKEKDNKLNRRGTPSGTTPNPTLRSGKHEDKSAEGILRMLLHDIQNHLQAIRMEIDLLDLESNHNLDFSKIVKTIGRVSLSLQDVGDYLSLKGLSFSEQRIDSILEDVAREFQSDFVEQGVKLRLHIGESLPLVVVDADKFRSVLERIIGFCKILLQDGGELEIEGLAPQQHGNQKLEVRFSMRSSTALEFDQNDPFSPFLRVNGRKIGLGLALVREILQRLHAELFFEKTFPERATITIALESREPDQQV